MVNIIELQVRRRKVERFIQSIEGLAELFTEFDIGQWAVLVDSMTVQDKDHITWHLKCGIELEAKILAARRPASSEVIFSFWR